MFGHDDNTQLTQDDSATQDATSTTSINSGVTASDTDVSAPAPTYDTPPSGSAYTATTPTPAPSPAPSSTPAVADSGDELLEIKQQALQQLSPLVGHLDQSPEEKFRTTMMMIQASDNQGLIKDAYAAAQQIEDEKTRAQALLDIVNEINYFTQQQMQ